MVSKLDKLLKQREAIENKIKRESVRDSARKRKLDTKRKILVGAYYMKKHVDEGTWKELEKLMDEFLVNRTDRNAFDLPEKEVIAKSSKKKA